METIEDSRVSPPPGTVVTADLPLNFLDIYGFSAPQVQRVFFYSLHHPSSHLRHTVVADLKDSLAVTLQYFFPFASNLIFPLPPGKPYLSYNDGCAVRLTVFESKSDFVYISGDHPRKVADLQALVPRISPPVTDDETGVKKQSVMEIQITLFPDFGISIGTTFLHSVADGRSFSSFMKAWAAIHRSKGNTTCIQSSTLPCHDRHLIKDEKDISSMFMKDMFRFEDVALAPAPASGENMRVTLKMSNVEIAMLKEWLKPHQETSKKIQNHKEDAKPLHVSTFVVCAAYIWVCLTKLKDQVAHYECDDDALCPLIFFADCRQRLAFPVPATYFGNCISQCFLAAKKHKLVGEKGFLAAVMAITEEVQRVKEKPIEQAENWLPIKAEVVKSGRDFLLIAGSPKFRVYETDFGWGKPKKTDIAHIVTYGPVCIDDGGRDGDGGGVEFGLAVNQSEVDALTALFEQGLKFS